MSSKKEVTHNGIVKSINKDGITVGIAVQEGCAGCQIKSSCSMTDQHSKELEIDCNASMYTTGQKVMVKLQAKQGMNAIFLAYVLPFLVLLTVMITTSKYIGNESLTGLLSLASVVPYYLALYFYRDKIKKKFTYVVYPLN